MKIKTTLILLIIILISCKKETNISESNQDYVGLLDKNTEKFDFTKFKIKKGKIGLIEVGMTMNEAEKHIMGLIKKENEPLNYGYDGGGKAYTYYFKNEPILALIPERDTNKILAIIAIHKNLRTYNGLNPNSSVKEIQTLYPSLQVNQDLIVSWEFMYDEKNNWRFEFLTDENRRIGEYKDVEDPAEPKRIQTKMDWITVE